MPEFPEIDKYSGIESPLHSWDPRVKLMSILFLIFSVVLLNDLIQAVIGLILSVALILVSGIPINFVLNRMRWVAFFVVFIFVILSLTTPQGVEKGALIAIRAGSAIILTLAMIGTTRFDQLLKAMEKLRIPNKLIQAFMFSYRYIFVLTQEIERMLISLKSRGFRKRTDLLTMKTIGNSIGMLFVRSYERSKRVYEAMISRGYSGIVNSMTEFKIRNTDYAKGILLIIVAISLHVI